MRAPDPQKTLAGLQLLQQAKQAHARRALPEAAAFYRRALALVPDHPQGLAGYAQLAEDAGDWPAAETLYRRLQMVSPGLANIDAKLGVALFNLGRYAECAPLLSAYLDRTPGDAQAWRLLGTALMRQGDLDGAIRCGERAWTLQKHPESICLMLTAMLETGEREPLASRVSEAMAAFPDDWQVRKFAAEFWLKDGAFGRAFDFMPEFRLQHGAEPHYVERIDVPAWDGRRFDGTLLVGGEQGIGDEILTASMYPDLVAMGQHACIEADVRLLPVLGRSFPSLEFVARDPGRLADIAGERPGCRKVIGNDLGRWFRRDRDAFAGRGPWIKVDVARRNAIRAGYCARWPGRVLAGLSWKSRRVMRSGKEKRVPLADFLPVLARPGVQFVSLQYGEVADEIAALGAHRERLFADPDIDAFNDIDGLFAQVAALDLVVTTSNVTAHVAGALGVPCIVLLPRRRPVIWYWGYSGETTPWYASIRLLRNTGDDEWTDAMSMLDRQVGAFVGAHRAESAR